MKLSIDGQGYRVTPARSLRINPGAGETAFTVVETGYRAALRAAWRGIRSTARDLGIPVDGPDDSLYWTARAMAEQIAALDREIAEWQDAARAASKESDR